MKKTVLIIALTLMAFPAKSQFIHHDVSASYGLVTSYQILDIIEDVLTTVFTFGTYEKDDYNYSGALFATYKYAATYRLNIGATLGMDRVRGDLIRNDIKYGDFSENHITLAAETDLRWVKRDAFQLYSGLGLGYTFNTERGEITDTGEIDTNSSGNVAFQINPLGMRIGRSLGGFVEFGFGYKGIINLGLSYQFE